VVTFLAECRSHGYRCVRIVHGKGLSSPGREPVLKKLVLGWLTQRSEVLAFCQARAAEGGAGAVIVLLAAKK
jgi:DNA-nicking Smr family endonuclease